MNKIENMTAVDLSLYLDATYPANALALARRKPVYGVGVNDAPYVTKPTIGGAQVPDLAYGAWKAMLQRAYGAKEHARRPAYQGVTVCEGWHSFMTFRRWWLEHYREGWELDKDLLIPGNREYGPAACLYVPAWVNLMTTDRAAARGALPIGVDGVRNRYRARCSNPISGKQEFLGHFPDPLSAHLVYQAAKLTHVHRLHNALCAIHPDLAAGVLGIVSERWEPIPRASCVVFDSGWEW